MLINVFQQIHEGSSCQQSVRNQCLKMQRLVNKPWSPLVLLYLAIPSHPTLPFHPKEVNKESYCLWLSEEVVFECT